MRIPDDDEREVAQAVVDWLVAGDDKIPCRSGTVTLHSVPRGRGLLPPPAEMRALVHGLPRETYELTITARRVKE